MTFEQDLFAQMMLLDDEPAPWKPAPQPDSSRPRKIGKYEQIMIEVWREQWGPNPGRNRYDFEKADIDRVITRLYPEDQRGIRNAADIKYSFDARKHPPEEMARTGHWAWIGRGKGRYTFVRLQQPNLIMLPELLPKFVPDATPERIREVLGEDEQSSVSRINHSNLIAVALGLEAVVVAKQHDKTSLEALGQFEIDALYVTTSGPRIAIPVSMKGNGDFLSYSQAYNLSRYGAENEVFRRLGHQIRPLGISKNEKTGDIYILEFSTAVDVEDIKILRMEAYRFTTC